MEVFQMRLKESVYIFDVRLVERHILQGKTTSGELQGYLKSLPDRSPDVETLGGKKKQDDEADEG
jgi:hypothetical protein